MVQVGPCQLELLMQAQAPQQWLHCSHSSSTHFLIEAGSEGACALRCAALRAQGLEERQLDVDAVLSCRTGETSTSVAKRHLVCKSRRVALCIMDPAGGAEGTNRILGAARGWAKPADAAMQQ